MRRLLVVLLMLGLAGSAMASTIIGNTPGVKPATEYSYTPPDGPRQAGDTIGSSTPIGALPFSDTGTTNGYFNDYDEICPYSGSASPDVVYSLHPSTDTCINVDLCFSSYDTKVYIYENAQGNLIACNDDFYFGAPCYTYSSAVNGVALTGGNTYYIVVDGYGSAAGSYQVDITVCEPPPPPPECVPPAFNENEPTCGTNYIDNWNGGCNSTPQVWQALDAAVGAGGCGTVCGLTCTYLNQGASYRDTDWFDSIGLGGNVTQTCMTDFAFMMALMYGPNCNNLLYIYILGNPNTPGSQSYPIASGAHVWSFMAPSSFSGVPNGSYILEVCGIQDGEPSPTQTTSWGSLKNNYR